ncbi:DUF262 domain-containing protein [Pseudomonas corrugata]|uniref:DUF262 domain-containing protein n=1 Tax=Pseudomonas corrugata TaxID=47879 RepID=UPI0006D88B53|nr:DUF262 domain-containing protein [Pseudomonas corrugata]AOE64027.1 hypothetical protein AXG94_20455 [Pseudomonas corrugata]
MSDEENLEGIDEQQGMGWGEYPLDSVFVRTEQRTVGEVVKRIGADRFILNPDFQRDFVWSAEKQSRLIESCLMRIPLPVFYVAEAKDGRIIVVDGLQRLTSFYRYLNNQFALSGLDSGAEEKKHPLTGDKYEDLHVSLQERIEDTQLTLYILDAKAPERAKLDIFERVNSGDPLTRQQMRNCLYNGPATLWLKEAANNETFITTTGGSLDRKKMRDREAINRFLAFYLLGEASYRGGDMDYFLASGLDMFNGLPPNERNEISEAFIHSMRVNKFLFKDHAFRKSLGALPHANRSVLNIALFDVLSVVFAGVDKDSVLQNQAALRAAVKGLIADEDFANSISYSTNSTKQVSNRFSIGRSKIMEALL